MYPNQFPVRQSGMMGDSWQANYEENLEVISTGATYRRGDGSSFEYSYNSKSKTYTLMSPLDERASLTFNSHTSTYTIALLDGSQRIFNSAGLPTAQIDPNGNQVTISHDASNRITQVTDAAVRVLTFNYATPGFPNLVSSMRDSVGTIASYTYDSLGHLASVTYADGSAINYNSDGAGLILSVTDSQGKILESHTYDNLRRGLTSARANGVDQVTVSYSGSGQSATLQDSSGNSTGYGNQRIATRNYILSVTGSGCDSCGGRGNYSFTYDSQGNRLTSTDPLGHLTKFTYDSNGNVTQKQIQSDSTGQNFQTWKYTYNSFGDVLTATDPLTRVTTNTYDTKGNLLTTTTPSPGGNVAGSKTTFTYDTKGELTKITDPLTHATTIAYFPAGLIQTITDAQSHLTQFQYDARGNRTSVTDVNNQQTTFTYDSMNRLTKVTYPPAPSRSRSWDTTIAGARAA
jgi:YD repeat-containing protein